MKRLFLILFFVLSQISFSANVWEVSPAECNLYVSGSCLIPIQVCNEHDFSRNKAWVGLYFSMSVSQSDIGKEFYFNVYNSSGEQVYVSKHKFKIALDSKNCCPSDTGCTSGFPQGYALFKYYPYDKKWYNQECLQSSEVRSYDDYISVLPFGLLCNNDDTVKIGHYLMDFLEESEIKGSSSFWITPDFSNIDKLSFWQDANSLRVYRDGGENRNTYGIVSTPSQANIYMQEMCREWEGAEAKILNYTYYPTYSDSRFYSGHEIHNPESFNPPAGTGPCRDCPCSRGGYSPAEGVLAYPNNSTSPFFHSAWNLPNTAGRYVFRGKVSKDFDGRIFSTENDTARMLGFGLKSLKGDPQEGQLFLIKNCDQGVDKHCTTTNYSDRYIDYESYFMLINVLDIFLKKIWQNYPDTMAYMPSITAGALARGGCFDMNGDWNCGGGVGHQKHKMGHNVDFRKNLYNALDPEIGIEFKNEYLKALKDTIREIYPDSGSFCAWHGTGANRHIHCRFYNGWYN